MRAALSATLHDLPVGHPDRREARELEALARQTGVVAPGTVLVVAHRADRGEQDQCQPLRK